MTIIDKQKSYEIESTLNDESKLNQASLSLAFSMLIRVQISCVQYTNLKVKFLFNVTCINQIVEEIMMCFKQV